MASDVFFVAPKKKGEKNEIVSVKHRLPHYLHRFIVYKGSSKQWFPFPQSLLGESECHVVFHSIIDESSLE